MFRNQGTSSPRLPIRKIYDGKNIHVLKRKNSTSTSIIELNFKCLRRWRWSTNLFTLYLVTNYNYSVQQSIEACRVIRSKHALAFHPPNDAVDVVASDENVWIIAKVNPSFTCRVAFHTILHTFLVYFDTTATWRRYDYPFRTKGSQTSSFTRYRKGKGGQGFTIRCFQTPLNMLRIMDLKTKSITDGKKR